VKGKIIFEETQSFVGTWLWYLILGVSVLVIVGIGIAMIAPISGSNEEWIAMIISIMVLTAVIALLTAAKLKVSIDSRSIYYRFAPFVNREKKLAKDDIKEIYVRKYRPIWEYGGWGYRFRFRSGRALNVAGNMGLQLILKNGKKVLIGTQKPELMKTAVKHLKENWEMNG
jgi:hypothetical protein